MVFYCLTFVGCAGVSDKGFDPIVPKSGFPDQVEHLPLVGWVRAIENDGKYLVVKKIVSLEKGTAVKVISESGMTEKEGIVVMDNGHYFSVVEVEESSGIVNGDAIVLDQKGSEDG